MKAAVAVTLLVVALAGCGANDDAEAPPRSALAEQLATLCDDARAEVEELGEPKDVGAGVFKPWSKIGTRFVADVQRLDGASAAEQRQLDRLATYYTGFFDSIAQSYLMHVSGESVGIKQTLERAYALLASGEKIAVQLGAPECAVRPFDAES